MSDRNAALFDFVIEVVQLLPHIINASITIRELYIKNAATIQKIMYEDRAPSVEEWLELKAVRDKLNAELDSGARP